MACGADVCLGGELSETRSPLREVGLDVRSVLYRGPYPNLPTGAFKMTSSSFDQQRFSAKGGERRNKFHLKRLFCSILSLCSCAVYLGLCYIDFGRR